jgi:hypothetical protein
MKSSAVSGDRNTTKEVLNCLRVLTRVLPVIFEVEGESSIFEMEVFWKKGEIEDETAPNPSEATQFVIEDEDDSEDEDNKPEATSTVDQSEAPTPLQQQSPALAERLFSSVIDLMFCCGFTLPTKFQKDHHKINYIIW